MTQSDSSANVHLFIGNAAPASQNDTTKMKIVGAVNNQPCFVTDRIFVPAGLGVYSFISGAISNGGVWINYNLA